jgi:hypothetical protein
MPEEKIYPFKSYYRSTLRHDAKTSTQTKEDISSLSAAEKRFLRTK